MGSKRMAMGLVSIVVLLLCANSATDKDKEECTEQLIGLATCLPYVGGSAKSPTPDCCSGLKQVLNTNKKCLCVVINDRNDPDLGLSINVTLALGLPSVCHAPANVTKCPELLHLAPNSSEAQVFYQFGHDSGPVASSPISSANSTSTSGKGSGTSAPKESNGSGSVKRWLTWEVIVSGVLFWFCTSMFFM